MKLLRNTILVQSLDTSKETLTQSGIILSEDVETANVDKGVVIEVGPGLLVNGKVVPTTVREGDEVLFDKGLCFEYDLKGKGACYFLSEDDLIAIL